MDTSLPNETIGGAEVPRDMDTKNNKAPWWAAVVLGGLLTGNLMILGWLANSLAGFNTAISNLDVAVGHNILQPYRVVRMWRRTA